MKHFDKVTLADLLKGLKSEEKFIKIYDSIVVDLNILEAIYKEKYPELEIQDLAVIKPKVDRIDFGIAKSVKKYEDNESITKEMISIYEKHLKPRVFTFYNERTEKSKPKKG